MDSRDDGGARLRFVCVSLRRMPIAGSSRRNTLCVWSMTLNPRWTPAQATSELNHLPAAILVCLRGSFCRHRAQDFFRIVLLLRFPMELWPCRLRPNSLPRLVSLSVCFLLLLSLLFCFSFCISRDADAGNCNSYHRKEYTQPSRTRFVFVRSWDLRAR